MTSEEREKFWQGVESGENLLLTSLHSLVEKYGLPEMMIQLGDICEVLIEDAEVCSLTPNQRGLILNACAQVCHLADQMKAEMDFLKESP